MGKVQKFEDLIAWQKSRDLAVLIYRTTASGNFSKDYDLTRQIRRAAVSVMSNIAEGFERGGRGEFHQFLVMAKASCAEVRSQLYLAHQIGYLTESDFENLMEIAGELARIISGLRSAVDKQRDERKKS